MSFVPRTCSSTHSSSRKLRVAVIGNSAVGKSSIISRYVENVFEWNLIHTIGIDFKSKMIDIEDKTIELQLWDTAGQEKFHSVTPSFCRNALGVVLMYDLTNSQSFKGISFWMSKVREHAPFNAEYMLLGNKYDLEQSRVVTEEMGREAAKRIGACFFEVSAVTGHNIETAFRAFAAIILHKQGFFASDREHLVTSTNSVINIVEPVDKPKDKKGCCSSQLSS